MFLTIIPTSALKQSTLQRNESLLVQRVLDDSSRWHKKKQITKVIERKLLKGKGDSGQHEIDGGNNPVSQFYGPSLRLGRPWRRNQIAANTESHSTSQILPRNSPRIIIDREKTISTFRIYAFEHQSHDRFSSIRRRRRSSRNECAYQANGTCELLQFPWRIPYATWLRSGRALSLNSIIVIKCSYFRGGVLCHSPYHPLENEIKEYLLSVIISELVFQKISYNKK